MNASEKLKALDERVQEQDWSTGATNREAYSLALSVIAALPQIVAVVEAATVLHERVEMDESVGICLSSRTESLTAGAALAALDEALS